MKSACAGALLVAVFALELSAQSASGRAEVSLGLGRIYHSTGAVIGGAILTPIGTGRGVSHWIGPVVQYARAEVASTGQHRSLLGGGALYLAQLPALGGVSAVLGAGVRYTHASVSNIPTVGLSDPVPSEDITATHRNGWSIGPQAGWRIRLSPTTSLGVMGFVEDQSIYSNASTRRVWGLALHAGFGL